MTKVMTILEAHIGRDRQDDIQNAYSAAIHEALPPGLLHTMLLQAVNDPALWRIESLWESRQALEAMRGAGTPRGVQIFRAAGAEPSLTVLNVVAGSRRPERGSGGSDEV